MSDIMNPSVAGMFYPAEPAVLGATVAQLLAEADPASHSIPKAIIAPHAGYVYSGPVAASAYALLRPAAEQIKRVVLLAPAHRYPFRGLATTAKQALRTPLGDVPIARQALQTVLDLPQVQVLEQAFAGEHALEVHLPFLQTALQAFSVLPFIVGEANGEQVAEVLARLWGGPETLIVISSDLSHFLDYATAKDRDAKTREAIEAMAPGRIGPYDACGCRPMGGLLTLANRLGLRVETLDLRNSGDTAGGRDRVVGYGAWAFYE